ncbi:hypothetical protein HGQ17_10105 [Nesterenkonia sp. MY13]|uniref:NTP pyrophosphohydrolase MazG-like domain-containing protein n=1 Tax=Nesterenkonia sedimenti TaxID=1463632 RepID=A0A7X8TL32_9MICC|nr:MazG nucleotide pyrophosphohydrolase domain-containing protein [Nesterenkonia sedimenti]NLS10337.1 hypothetical protein [Nesterenkonia sedimenti]
MENFTRLKEIIGHLREHCPWTGQLTHQSLTPYLIEEAQEVAEEIREGAHGDPLRKELGDILLQVALHAAIAEEREEFDFDAVAEAICAKLIRRNPHVFEPDGTLNPQQASIEEIDAAWNRIKQQEKAEEASRAAGLD